MGGEVVIWKRCEVGGGGCGGSDVGRRIRADVRNGYWMRMREGQRETNTSIDCLSRLSVLAACAACVRRPSTRGACCSARPGRVARGPRPSRVRVWSRDRGAPSVLTSLPTEGDRRGRLLLQGVLCHPSHCTTSSTSCRTAPPPTISTAPAVPAISATVYLGRE